MKLKIEHFAEEMTAFFFKNFLYDKTLQDEALAFSNLRAGEFYFYETPDFTSPVNLSKLVRILECAEGSQEVKANEPLQRIVGNNYELGFGGFHGIDIAIPFKDNSYYPIEVKSGKTGKCRSFPETFLNFITRSSQPPKTTHRPPRYKGNMINLLDGFEGWDVKVNTRSGMKVHPKWGLVYWGHEMGRYGGEATFQNLEFLLGLDVIYKILNETHKIEEFKTNLNEAFAKFIHAEWEL